MPNNSEVEPTTPEGWNKLGVKYLDSKEYDKAIDCFYNAIKLNDNFIQAHVNRANAYSEKGEHDKAFECYEEATKVNPDHFGGWYGLGLEYLNKKKYDAAIQSLENAAELDPNSPFSMELFRKGIWSKKAICQSHKNI